MIKIILTFIHMILGEVGYKAFLDRHFKKMWDAKNKLESLPELFSEEKYLIARANLDITLLNDDDLKRLDLIRENLKVLVGASIIKTSVRFTRFIYTGQSKNLTVYRVKRKLEEIKPPGLLIFLAGLTIDAKERAAALGDIEERYVIEAEKHGERSAKWWLAGDIFWSIKPYLQNLSRSGILRVFKWLGIAELIRRYWGGS